LVTDDAYNVQTAMIPRQEVYTVESLPFEHYMHHPSPINKNYQEWFNNYEELPKMTKVKYIPFGSDDS
ncbi:hypothetical protein ACFKKH_00995, partial [Streptococcus agalactiae]|uniref:hypothetical protein n=1 Tax=Streptococcus agalactiae TaxID=1311 RepID=UPI00363B17C4